MIFRGHCLCDAASFVIVIKSLLWMAQVGCIKVFVLLYLQALKFLSNNKLKGNISIQKNKKRSNLARNVCVLYVS